MNLRLFSLKNVYLKQFVRSDSQIYPPCFYGNGKETVSVKPLKGVDCR